MTQTSSPVKKAFPTGSSSLNHGVLTKRIEKWDYEGSGTEEDPYVVEWIKKDPWNPMTWGNTKKWVMTLAMATAILTVSFCSSPSSGGIQQIIVEFGTSQQVAT